MKPASIEIRGLQRDDVAHVIALLADDPIGRQREAPSEATPYLAAFDALTEDPAAYCLVAIDDGGSVVGYLQLTVTRHLSYRGSRRALLEDLRVSPAHRGAGIGTRLVEAAIAAARAHDCTVLQLLVHQDRAAARHFYRRFGFQAQHVGLRLAL